MKKIFTLMAAMLLVPWVGWGQETGDFSVTGDVSNYSFSDGVLNIVGNVSVSTSTETDDVIIINGGKENNPIEVTLVGINIINDETTPITISQGSHVKLILKNENAITGGDGLNDPNINLPVALQIQSTSTNKTYVEISGTGSLTTYAKHSAIGTYSEIENGAASDFILTISEGTINATTYTHEDYATIGGHNSSGFTINITGGKICEGKGPYAKGWAIGGDNATINISGGEIVSLGKGNAIGGSNSKINITDGYLNLDITNTSVAIGDDSTTPKSNITISGGHIEIHSDGLSDNIQGNSFSTGDDGDPIILIDATKTAKDYWSMNVPRTNVNEWQGFIFERQIRDMIDFGENGSQPEYSLDGYIYGNVTLAENVEIIDGQTLTIIKDADFTETDYSLSVNGGDIYLAYESEDKRNEISGNGNYHYEIFYDENLKFPEELEDVTAELNTCVVLSDYLPHEHKGTWENEAYRVRYDYSNNDEEMLFGEEGETLEFVWNEKAQLGDLLSPSPTEGWELERIKAVKTKANSAITNTTNTSFMMPGEAITITDFSLRKKSYNLTVNECPEEFEVHFENENGDVITESVWGETVYVVVSAPGYESFEVTKIQEFDKIFGPKINATEEKGRYYLEMPKKDVKVNIEGTASNRQTYTIKVDENIQHGQISYECGEGVDAEKIHYKDKIIVNIDEIEDGYGLESLKYIYNDGETQKEGEIAYDESAKEYSFLMPAADVTITAVFSEIKYTVSVSEDIVNGTVIVMDENENQVNEFVPGSKVVLNPIPEEGFIPDELSYTYMEGGEEKTEPIPGVSFEMPKADVTINATFVLKPTTGDDDDDEEGSGIAQKRYRLYLADQDFYLNDEYDEAGLVLYSRHDKKYTDVGGSFTIWFEKHGEVNEGARVFISNRANGEYKEVKLDEVSGYYQIRNVQSNIYVKLYTEEGFPVSNETIEATEARAYAQPNKIVVITPEPTEVQIISMAGAVVATAQVAGQQEFANLTEGVYIVRMGEDIVKLQVRN